MSVRLDGNVVRLEGSCRVEDAELLLASLQAEPGRVVDLTEAEHLHAAVLQILLVLRPATRGTPRNAFLRDWVGPALAGKDAEAVGPQNG